MFPRHQAVYFLPWPRPYYSGPAPPYLFNNPLAIDPYQHGRKPVDFGYRRASPVRLIISIAIAFACGSVCLGQSGLDRVTIIDFGEKAAIAAVNFKEGDTIGFTRARDNFTPDGWKDFVKHNEAYLDEKGAPTFTSSFVPSASARIVGEQNGTVHFRIPGTLTQSNKLGKTTYRAALEVFAGGKPSKIHKLEQITCAGASAACQ
jgi:hypothetical protein